MKYYAKTTDGSVFSFEAENNHNASIRAASIADAQKWAVVAVVPERDFVNSGKTIITVNLEGNREAA